MSYSVPSLKPLRDEITRLENEVAGRRFVSAPQSLSAGALVEVSHGLGQVPRHVTLRLVCVVADAGYSPGDQVIVDYNGSNASNNRYSTPRVDASKVYVRLSSDAGFAFAAANKDTGGVTGLSNDDWELIVEAMI